MSENNLQNRECPSAAATAQDSSLDNLESPVESPVPKVDFESDEPLIAEAPVVEAEGTPPTVLVNPQPGSPSGETSFQDLALSQAVQQAVQKSGYDKPTPIQAEIIPHMLAGRDLLAQSHTGTGKTAAFALPILSRLKTVSKHPKVLVLTPTRELAIQVAKSFTTYAACLPEFAVTVIYGGQDYEVQFKQLRRGAHVVVGTPGRVIDHIKRRTLDLSQLECLVLDEADEMLNMGFLEDVQFVLEKTPAERQIALFSATLPTPIRNIAQKYLNHPAKITIKNKTMTVDSIRQRALFVTPREKIGVLKRILEVEESDGVIVFTKTRDTTVLVAEKLHREGLSAMALNGDMPQRVRERTIEQLRSGKIDILVATDVAARGLDVTRISHVFNFDLPHDSKSYIHRVGRTGRAGRKGEAIIFLTKTQRGKLRSIEKATRQPIEVVQPPTADDINAIRTRQFHRQITHIMAHHDLTLFKKLITEYAETSEKPMVMIAAALAQMGQRGRKFFMEDRPNSKKRDHNKQSSKEPRHDRFERASPGSFSNRPRQGRKGESRLLGPPEPGMMRCRIEVGRKDGVRPGNIVGAVANEAGIAGEYIGPIKIHDSFSTIDLPDEMPTDVYQTLQQTKVAGKHLRLSRPGEARSKPGDGHSKGPRRDRPSGRRSVGNKAPGKKTYAGKKATRKKSTRAEKRKK